MVSQALQEPLLPKDVAPVVSTDAPDAKVKHHRVILAKLRPTGRVAVDGLASEYADAFTPPLQKLMAEADFRAAIAAINQTCYDYFPCTACVVYAYFGVALSCGLLFCCVRPCTGEVQENLELVIDRINAKKVFLDQGVAWSLERTRCHSWIEITQCPEERRKSASHRHSI